MIKPSEADSQNPTMHWAWGELPQAATVRKKNKQKKHDKMWQKQISFLHCQWLYFLHLPAILPDSEIWASTTVPGIHPYVWKHTLPRDNSRNLFWAVQTMFRHIRTQSVNDPGGYRWGGRHCPEGVRQSGDGGRNYQSWWSGGLWHGGDCNPSTRQNRFSIQEKR